MFNPQPKSLPKEKKKFGHAYWNEIKKKSLEKKKMKIAPIADKDDRFYRFLWNNRERFCEECGRELKTFNKDMFHHILPKVAYNYFRYESKNIVMLCGKFGCHSKAESAISYPKMRIFERCEKIKKDLLESVGMEYRKYSEV